MTVSSASSSPAPSSAGDLVLRVERRRPGSERRFQRVVRADDGTLTAEATPWLPSSTAFSNGGQGLPWSTLGTTGHTDLSALLRGTPQLTALLHREIARFTTVGPDLTGGHLVDLLRPSVAGGPEDPAAWTEDESQDWTQLDAWAVKNIAGATPFARWASVDDEDVVVVDVSAGAGGTRFADLVALLVDGDEGGLRGGETVASYSWWSDGEITSWDGGAVVERVGRSAALFRDTGDSLGTPAVVAWPRTCREQAAVIVRWLDRHDAGVAAALCWEPLDPTGRRLTARERTRWESALEGVSATVDVTSPALQRAVRARLSADEGSSYSRARRALLHPRRPEGEELYERLDAVACGGPLWDLLNG